MTPTDFAFTDAFPAMLFKHNRWANLTLFDFCVAAPASVWTTEVGGGFGTLVETWRHIASAEVSYTYRLANATALPKSERPVFETQAQVRASLARTGTLLLELAARAASLPSSLVEWEHYRAEVPAALVLTQAINHATEHRAQIMVILTQAGIAPPDVSGWTYLDA